MRKEDASLADWVMADAAVDIQSHIQAWDFMTEEQHWDALERLQERLLGTIENIGARKDAQERIEEIILENFIDGDDEDEDED